jgi:hypothetical protein
MNLSLNPGGLIGALAGLGGAIFYLYINRETAFNRPGAMMPLWLAVIGGGLAGNWLWKQVFPRKPSAKARGLHAMERRR